MYKHTYGTKNMRITFSYAFNTKLWQCNFVIFADWTNSVYNADCVCHAMRTQLPIETYRANPSSKERA